MQDPIIIFAAADNWEAQFVRVLLEQNGIEAMAVDDLSMVGLMTVGTMPGIHHPKVFVDRRQSEQAAVVVRQYVERLQQERGVSEAARRQAADVEVKCEKCGKTSRFKASQQGTVQQCRHCAAYLDVGQPPAEASERDEQ